MKKLVGLFVGLLMVFGVVGSVSATPLYVELGDDSSVTLAATPAWDFYGATGNLTAQLNENLGSLSETIIDGETWEVEFFTLTAAIGWTGFSAGTFDIEATLDIDVPEASAEGSGSGDWGSWMGWISGGVLTWDQNTLPDVVTLADGSTLSIDFEDGVALTCGSSVAVKALLTYDAAAPVPEPGTMMLFGIGLLGLAGVNRRKK